MLIVIQTEIHGQVKWMADAETSLREVKWMADAETSLREVKWMADAETSLREVMYMGGGVASDPAPFGRKEGLVFAHALN